MLAVRRFFRVSSFVRNFSISHDEIVALAQVCPTPLTLQQMKTFATHGPELRLKSAVFLHKELQIRFARAIVELSELPIGLNETKAVRMAMATYTSHLENVRKSKVPTNMEEDAEFTNMIGAMKKEGSNLVPLICGGLQEVSHTEEGRNALRLQEIQDSVNSHLDTFFLSRIGIRMLIGQHSTDGGRVKLCDVQDIVKEASDRASALCRKFCGPPPEVIVKVAANGAAPFMYVRSHLHHMVFELLKNSMQATVELYGPNAKIRERSACSPLKPKMNHLSPLIGFVIPDIEHLDGVTIFPHHSHSLSGTLPPITVVISQGQEDLTIKISDVAGGVKRSDWNRLFYYTHTTSTKEPPSSLATGEFREHFSGGGYGLPIARLFARYFGGEITFLSSEGYGSSAFIQAHRLGRQTELVPGHTNFTLQPLKF
ncbi:pyruvate dehydrogenase [Thraustotheca clavata]|uniref:Protein-serine/threonine kinase n=1 Tax=Thraustotheca clavata TaxID=74557 RepID=A0A1V9Z5D2_9STRA|nr:pyruvate dehydrogenase [Thraustotheca clavata]